MKVSEAALNEDGCASLLTPLFAQANPVATKRLIFLSMLFVSFLIISNFTAFKIIELPLTTHFSLDFPAASAFFPLTYFLDDVLTEVYGFKMSRLVIWGGLVCSTLASGCTWVAVHLPASPTWDLNTHQGEKAYELIFNGSLRILIASIFAYFFGEFVNSALLAKLKVFTKGRYFPLRVMSSTLIGVGIDSIIFCNIAFWYIMPQSMIWKIIFTLYMFKCSYEFVMLPVTYTLTAYLKKADKIDYYDIHTKLNPFSLSLD